MPYHPNAIDIAAEILVQELSWSMKELKGLKVLFWYTEEGIEYACGRFVAGCAQPRVDVTRSEKMNRVDILVTDSCIGYTSFMHELIHVWHSRKGWDIDYGHDDERCPWGAIDEKLRTQVWLSACGGVHTVIGH